MRKVFFTFIIASLWLSSQAQTVVTDTTDTESQIPNLNPSTDRRTPATDTREIIMGYLSYDVALQQMPQYAIVEAKMKELRQQFDAEMKRVESDFNQKYEAFLEGQRNYPRTILLKRQNELQQLLQQNIEFKQQAQEELRKAREEAMMPLRERLNEAIATVARRHHLILAVNTDSNACPFIDPDTSVALQEEVRELLSKTR